MEKQMELFKTITMLPGVAGHEKHVAKFLEKQYIELCDEIIYDNLGSVVAYKKSKVANPKKVMILGHMDEVGFLVTQITSQGMLKIHPLGGWNSQTLLAHTVKVYPSDDLQKGVTGVIASVPVHLLRGNAQEYVVPIKDMLVDVGATCYQEVVDFGIRPGDMVVVEGKFESMLNKKRLLAKAWDNRYGCALGVELLQELKDVELPFDLYIGASVQEEVGVRGAKTITSVINPDFAIVLDASPANDMLSSQDVFGKLGEGALVRIIDANMVPNQKVLRYAQDLFEKNNLKHQYYLSYGGTDAGSVHIYNEGIPTLTTCICSRYIHTSHSIIDLDDYNSAKSFLKILLNQLDDKVIEDFKRF